MSARERFVASIMMMRDLENQQMARDSACMLLGMWIADKCIEGTEDSNWCYQKICELFG